MGVVRGSTPKFSTVIKGGAGQYPGGAAAFKTAMKNARFRILWGAMKDKLATHIDPPVFQIIGCDQFKGFEAGINPFYLCAQ